jgi:hypothetical protein
MPSHVQAQFEFECFRRSFTAVFPKCHDAVVQWQLVYAKFHGSVTSALATIPVDEIRHALNHSLLRRSGDFEMQMWLAGITRIADARQYLALPHAVPGLHAAMSD